MVVAQPPRNFTHGEILRWRRVGGLVLAEVEYEAIGGHAWVFRDGRWQKVAY